MTDKRRQVPIVQFAIHPVSGEMFALDARGTMWAGGREQADNGRVRMRWQRLGGIPAEAYDGDNGPTDSVEYIPPPSGG